MGSSRFWMAVLAGTIVAFILAWISYELLFASFFENAMQVPGALKEEPQLGLIFIGEIIFSILVVQVMVWKGDANAAQGATTAATIWFLVGAALSFIFLGAWNTTTVAASVVDTLIGTVRGGIAGAVMGMVLAKGAAEGGGSEFPA